MSVSVTLYNFSKKLNSTAVPSGGTTVSCQLRDGSGKYNPNLELRGTNPSGYNYMYIGLWGRYYYINECTWNAEEHFWLLSGTVDAPASFRSAILGSTQMVVRCSDSGHENVNVADSLALPTGETYKVANTFGGTLIPDFTSSWSDMAVICNIAGSGFVVMSGQSYTRLLTRFFEQNDILTNEYWTRDIARQIINPASHFISQMALPISYNAVAGNLRWSDGKTYIGWWGVDVSCFYVASTVLTYSTTVTVPFHPQTNGNPSHYLNSPPFVTHDMYIPGFGQIAIDSNKVRAGDTLNVNVYIDVIGGGAKVVIYESYYGQVVGYSVAQMGFEVAMASRNPVNAVGMIGSMLIGGAVGGPMGAIGGAMHGVSSLQGIGGAITSGSTGGAGGWYDLSRARLNTCFKQVQQASRYRQGRPCYIDLSLSGLSGLVVCDRPTIACNGSKDELKEIYDYMLTGIYLE